MSEQYMHGTRGNWHKCMDNPVLGKQYGTCFDISVTHKDGVLRMYFSWRDCHSIAVVESIDGISWGKPEICLTPRESSEGWEEAVNRPFVLERDGFYHMWYTGQKGPGLRDGHSYIFYAISYDGVHFERVKNTPVLEPEHPWEKNAVMNPSVIWDDECSMYKMWYSAGEQYEPDAFGYAVSRDGIHWDKHSSNPIFSADSNSMWEQHKVGGCQVFKLDDWYRMFYIGYHTEDYTQIGMARSKDGVNNWERSPLNPIICPDKGSWDGEACYKPFVLKMDDGWYLWYNGRCGNVEQIGMAVQPGEVLEFE